MAAEKAFYKQPTSLENTIFLYGFNAILRTGWRITARIWQQRRYAPLIYSNGENNNRANELPHVQQFSEKTMTQ